MTADPNVYIVDDSADYIFLVEQVFRRFLPGWSPRFFSSGEALCDSMQTEAAYPRLVLMDLNMPPGRSGCETLQLLRQNARWQRIPVVIMSDTTAERDIQACFDAGATSFVSKPVGIEAMKQVMGETCNYWVNLHQTPL